MSRDSIPRILVYAEYAQHMLGPLKDFEGPYPQYLRTLSLIFVDSTLKIFVYTEYVLSIYSAYAISLCRVELLFSTPAERSTPPELFSTPSEL